MTKDQEQANNRASEGNTDDRLGVVPETDTATITEVVPFGWVAVEEMEYITQRMRRRYLVTYTHGGVTHHALAVDDGALGLARTFANAVRVDVERQRYVDSAFPLVLAQLPLEVTL